MLPQPQSPPSPSKKKAILFLRSLLIVSAWTLFSYRSGTGAALYGHIVFAVFAASTLALLFVKEEFFRNTRVTFTLVVVDTILAAILLYDRGVADYGAFLAFFLMILLAAAGQRLRMILTAGVLVGTGYILISLHTQTLSELLTRPTFLLKFPFFFVVAIFYGYFLDENESLRETLTYYTRRIEHYGAEIQKTYWETLQALVNALDLRDTATRHHSLRVTAYTLTLSRKLGVPERRWPDIERGALLHDIGKIGVSDTILLKKGPLNESEWDLMKRHPQLGYQMVQGIPFLEGASDIILYHHERYDGTGYPFRLQGKSIPLSARVFAVADAMDAICSGRPYKERQGLEEVETALRKGSGTQFDPRVVDAYFQIPREEWLGLQRRLEGESASGAPPSEFVLPMGPPEALSAPGRPPRGAATP